MCSKALVRGTEEHRLCSLPSLKVCKGGGLSHIPGCLTPDLQINKN